MPDETPTVFISYQHGDGELPRELAAGLREAGLAVWIDEEELLIGSSLIEQLATAVEGVDYFLALISPASINPRWCQKEISMALTVRSSSVAGGPVAAHCPRRGSSLRSPSVTRIG